jgi:hypothetical protein
VIKIFSNFGIYCELRWLIAVPFCVNEPRFPDFYYISFFRLHFWRWLSWFNYIAVKWSPRPLNISHVMNPQHKRADVMTSSFYLFLSIMDNSSKCQFWYCMSRFFGDFFVLSGHIFFSFIYCDCDVDVRRVTSLKIRIFHLSYKR